MSKDQTVVKFSVYRKGAQVSATVFNDPNHRDASQEAAWKMSPFVETFANGSGHAVFNPIKGEVELKVASGESVEYREEWQVFDAETFDVISPYLMERIAFPTWAPPKKLVVAED